MKPFSMQNDRFMHNKYSWSSFETTGLNFFCPLTPPLCSYLPGSYKKRLSIINTVSSQMSLFNHSQTISSRQRKCVFFFKEKRGDSQYLLIMACSGPLKTKYKNLIFRGIGMIYKCQFYQLIFKSHT